jgi:Undecaprenyl-phosphate glucose phosphotransferase
MSVQEGVLTDLGHLRARPAFRPSAKTRWMSALGRNTAAVRALFGLVAAVCDVAAIVLAALATGFVYHGIFYERAGMLEAFLHLGFIIAALFVMPNAMRQDYDSRLYLTFEGHARRCFTMWNVAFGSALLLAFMSKTSSDFSRGTGFLFYVCGFGGVCMVRLVLVRILRDHARDGGAAARRVFIIGYEDEVRRFTDQHDPSDLGMRIVSAAVLRGPQTLAEDLALAAASARVLRPEDVYLLVPWGDKAAIDASVNAFMRVPASIHLGAERVLERFHDVRLERNGPITSISLVRKPLSLAEVIMKRIVDVTLASLALILLSPLMLATAVAIKLESRGPVLFFQRRYGFNQETFRICKFRSMRAMEDDRHLRQATANDARVTRVGRVIRRLNLDELPQLVNVLRGEMSLVGPRPHALAHDQLYERSIALYARRHNVKPGITGWAQVNGFRGETNTEDKMRARVDYDLHYIDNWSLSLDLRILWLTVFSRKAYRNAC